MNTLETHKRGCHACDTDSLCPTGTEIRTKELTRALTACYKWRKSRYAQSETGIRTKGGNCFNEQNAAAERDRLEAEAERIGLDWRAIRNTVYK